jgi:hypothetical protein
MTIETDAHGDLELEPESAEHVTGGRKLKTSTPKTRSAPNQTVAAVTPIAVAPDDSQTAFPVLSGDECEPIRYGESSSGGSAT